jgi:hypothetical protein
MQCPKDLERQLCERLDALGQFPEPNCSASSCSRLRDIDSRPVTVSVLELWRYPVKSLLGEPLEEVEVDERGFVGDRLFAVVDSNGKIGSGKTTRRFPCLPG